MQNRVIQRVPFGPLNMAFLLGYIWLGYTNPLETAWMVFTLQLTLRFFWWQNISHFGGGLTLSLAEVHFNVLEANYFHVSLKELFPQKRAQQPIGLHRGVSRSSRRTANGVAKVISRFGRGYEFCEIVP